MSRVPCAQVVGTEEELGAWDGSLGAWDGSQGLSLHLKGSSTWVGAAMVPLGASVEFTLATHLAGDEGGDVAWESVLGGSRRLQVCPPAFRPLLLAQLLRDSHAFHAPVPQLPLLHAPKPPTTP